MTKEFQYMKEGLAADLVELLMDDFQLDITTAMKTLYESDTYSKLCVPSTGLYFQAPRYVYSLLKSELETGQIS